jgi:multidrug efflux pump
LFYIYIPKELVPKEDQGYLVVTGNVPDTTNSHFLLKETAKLNSIYRQNSNLDRYVYINNIPAQHQFLSYVTLKDWNARTLTAEQIKTQLQADINQISGVNAVVLEPTALPIGNITPLEFVIKTTKDARELFEMADEIEKNLQKSGLFFYVNQDVCFDVPKFEIKIDAEKAADVNLSANNVLQNIHWLFNQARFHQFHQNNKNYDLILDVDAPLLAGAASLNDLRLTNAQGRTISLTQIAKRTLVISPNSINHFQKLLSITLKAALRPNVSLSKGMDYLRGQALRRLPPSMSYEFSGECRLFLQENGRFLALFLCSALLIFLLLSVLFESYRDTWVVLAGTIPHTIFFGLLTIFLSGTGMNIYSQIALLTLMGLISKHGILMVKAAKALQKCGVLSRQEAIIQAAVSRFRPILMTTVAMASGVIPLIIYSGPGAHARFSIGIVLSVGVLLGTMGVLFLMPVIYAREKFKCYI